MHNAGTKPITGNKPRQSFVVVLKVLVIKYDVRWYGGEGTNRWR